MKLRRAVMRNHCRRVAEKHRDETRGVPGGRRTKRAAFQAAMADLGKPSVRSGRLRAYGERWDFRLDRVYRFMRGWAWRYGNVKLVYPSRLWAGSWF